MASWPGDAVVPAMIDCENLVAAIPREAKDLVGNGKTKRRGQVVVRSWVRRICVINEVAVVNI